MAGKYIILGATGGVGSRVVRDLTSLGHAVHIIGRNAENLETLADQLDGVTYATADAKNPDSIKAAVLEGADGPVHGLVYAIGSIDLKPLKRITSIDLTHAFQINVASALTAVQAAAPNLKEGKGAVVLFSSVAAGMGFANHAITGTIKAGVEGLTVALAAELAPDIRVNSVAPSLMDTPMARDITGSKAMAEAIAKSHPMGRIGTATDMSDIVALLLKQETWITGQVFHVDGGRSSIAGR